MVKHDRKKEIDQQLFGDLENKIQQLGQLRKLKNDFKRSQAPELSSKYRKVIESVLKKQSMSLAGVEDSTDFSPVIDDEKNADEEVKKENNHRTKRIYEDP